MKTPKTDEASDRDPFEEALDLLVFAPLGLALELRTLLPGLIERGRRQLSFARSVGQVAANSVATKPRSSAREESKAETASKSSTAKPTQKKKPAAEAKPVVSKPAVKKKPAAAKKTAAKKTAARNKPVANKAAVKKKPAVKAAKAATKPAVKKKPAAAKKKPAAKKAATRKPAAKPAAPRSLTAIVPNYDELSAREILQAVAGLGEADLKVVAAYEQANRARVTVLNRMAQLIGS